MKVIENIILSVIIVYSFSYNLKSQGKEHFNSNKLLKQKGLFVYAGVGTTYPNKAIKMNAHLTNTFGYNLSVFIPFVKSEKVSFGIQIGGSYFYGKQSQVAINALSYNISGQQSSPVLHLNSNGSPIFTGFGVFFGPQLNFLVGRHLIISPVLEGSFLNINNHSFNVIQKSVVDNGNAELRSYELLYQTSEYASSFGVNCFAPKLRLHYFFNNHLGIWMEASYLIGPKLDTKFTKLTPKGNPNQYGAYSLSQMDAGTYDTYISTTLYTSIGLNMGIVIKLPPHVRKIH